MPIYGIRGATTVNHDKPEEILEATREMLQQILLKNLALQPQDMASALFTLTEDLCSVYPAKAAREFGWTHVPLMCAREIPVPGSLPHCVRVLIHWNTTLRQDEIQHIYLRGAVVLRPDLKQT